MILRLPAPNNLGVCSRCWAAATPHNSAAGGVLADVPYLRVRFCETYDRVGDRVSSPLLVGDQFVMDGHRLVVKTAEVQKDVVPENDGAAGHSWVWVIEAVAAGGLEGS
jgi:hypothetical protein